MRLSQIYLKLVGFCSIRWREPRICEVSNARLFLTQISRVTQFTASGRVSNAALVKRRGGVVARRVFFSFHYDRDVRRIVQVRNSWIIRAKGEAQPFYDAAEFEAVKSRAGGIEKWIEQQLAGTSVTVVLFGAETYERKWVRHEIKRSYELKKGILAIDIHNVKDPQTGVDRQGKNPLDYWHIDRAGQKITFSDLYSTYDWVRDDGYKNIANWIDSAARAATR